MKREPSYLLLQLLQRHLSPWQLHLRCTLLPLGPLRDPTRTPVNQRIDHQAQISRRLQPFYCRLFQSTTYICNKCFHISADMQALLPSNHVSYTCMIVHVDVFFCNLIYMYFCYTSYLSLMMLLNLAPHPVLV